MDTPDDRVRDGHTARFPAVPAAPGPARPVRPPAQPPQPPPPEPGSGNNGRRVTLIVLAGAAAVAVGVTAGALIGGWRPGGTDSSASSPTVTVTLNASPSPSSPSASPTSASPSPTPTRELQPVAKVAAGGVGGDGWDAGEGFSGGSVADNVSDRPVDTSRVRDPAPEGVYQSERLGDFSYTREGLEPESPVRLRLHFAEVWFEGEGQRRFDVSVNGDEVLSDFDVFAQAGGRDVAIVQDIQARADDEGRVEVEFRSKTNQAKLSAIEISGVERE